MRILTVAGSSGGHIFPMMGFLDTLTDKRKDIDVLLVLSRKSINNRLESFKYKINYISTTSIKLGFGLGNFGAILKFFKGAWESFVILLRFRPDVVVGFGSLVSLPVIVFARLLGMKTLIHEQNVIPGRANRFLAGFTDKIAISFSQTAGYFRNYKREIFLTGNPIRKELIRVDKNEAVDSFGLKSGKFTVLVMGGSQGSRRINFGFLSALSAMQDKSGLQVIHLAGDKDLDLLKRNYNDLGINFRLFDFLESMQYAYSACDLVISRAGATTIAEIMFFGLPAIIIPYPFAYKHQIANAEVLKTIGSGIILRDEELESAILSKNIEYLMNNPERVKAMRSCYESVSQLNANDLLVESALSL